MWSLAYLQCFRIIDLGSWPICPSPFTPHPPQKSITDWTALQSMLLWQVYHILTCISTALTGQPYSAMHQYVIVSLIFVHMSTIRNWKKPYETWQQSGVNMYISLLWDQQWHSYFMFNSIAMGCFADESVNTPWLMIKQISKTSLSYHGIFIALKLFVMLVTLILLFLYRSLEPL